VDIGHANIGTCPLLGKICDVKDGIRKRPGREGD